MTENVPARRPNGVLAELERCRPFINEQLPEHMRGERFIRLALTTIRKTPDLQSCTPASFVGALYTASALGLEPDTNGECYLIPFKNKRSGTKEATLVIGYQGLAKLFWQHPLAARLSAEYVCENDDFTYDKGLTPSLHHTPAAGDRGKVVAYYAIVGLKNGAVWFDVFTPAQILALRGKQPVSDKAEIKDPEHWMERKTALRQVLKLAPKSTTLALADRVDERVGLTVDKVGVEVAKGIDPGDLPYVDAEVVAEGPDPWENTVDPETGELPIPEDPA